MRAISHQPPSAAVLTRQDELWVLDKPAGMAVHSGSPSLVEWARDEAGAPDGLAPIHRLDLETSGVVLCSASPEVRAEVGGWFAAGEVHKHYLALVHGRTRKEGVIRRPLQDARRRRPLEAVTRYRCLAWLGPLSLLRVRPETGRRHQIRRHLQSIGHAVVGDERYPPPRFRPVPAFPGRLWLHCQRLRLPDGRSFRSPLPEALAAHLDALESIAETREDG